MSRVGKNPVVIPQGVTVTRDGAALKFKGPKGETSMSVHEAVTVTIEGDQISVTRPSDNKLHRSLHGTTRANIQNCVLGVSNGFARNLELVGVGYRAEMRGVNLQIQLGYSHPIVFFPPKGITITVGTPTTITIAGIDKQLVGQIAAKVRSLRPPEPYKGKGVKYDNEQIRRKAGKTAKS